VFRVFGEEGFDSGNKGRKRSFHIGGTAPKEHTVAHGGNEWVACPLPERTGGYDIGMAGKTDRGSGSPASCPKILYPAVTHFFYAKAQWLQTFNQNNLATRILGSKRAAGEQFLGEIQRTIHWNAPSIAWVTLSSISSANFFAGHPSATVVGLMNKLDARSAFLLSVRGREQSASIARSVLLISFIYHALQTTMPLMPFR
jgi:hypothetical protein